MYEDFGPFVLHEKQTNYHTTYIIKIFHVSDDNDARLQNFFVENVLPKISNRNEFLTTLETISKPPNVFYELNETVILPAFTQELHMLTSLLRKLK